MTENEIEMLLPSRDCPVGGGNTEAGSSTALLAVGRTESGTVVGPMVEALEGRHMAIVGETGMGKSALLVSLARQAAGAHGLVVFDPTGETVRSIGRELGHIDGDRVLVIDPVREPLAINAFEGITAAPEERFRAERRLNDIVLSLRRVRAGRYGKTPFWGPLIEEMVTRALRAAATLERPTLEDAHTLLATQGRAPRPSTPEGLAALRELAERIRERPSDAEGARRLLHEVVENPVLRRMLCARRPEMSTPEIVRPGRVVLLSGSAAGVGETISRYLLSVYLALVWSELLARGPTAKTFVFLDEAHLYANESLSEMLRLGRKQNVHVVLATQSSSAFSEDIEEAVWTNVADFVAFRGSPEEAREFSRIARSVLPDDILALPRGHAAVLIGKGNVVRWVRTARRPNGDEGPGSGEGVRVHRDHEPDPALRPPSSDLPDPEGGLVPPHPIAPPEVGEREGGHGSTPERVLAWIRERAGEPGGDLRIALSDLRRAVDPAGSAVREAGSRLRRTGALLAVERTAGGSVWVLSRERLVGPVLDTAGSSGEEDSRSPQPS